MPLTSGTQLGPYEILAPLGAGGMGEVYRARDPRLGREVAIKVLPAEVASHPDRLARFEREAKTVAALNHPNIVTLFSIEEASGTRFLTMELVEGENLERQVRPGGLPLERALDLTIPLADALVAAHERGVVHRDLKPGNVMVTREGRVKVLDFGLAKLASAESGLDQTQAATLAAPISTAGQVVGTVPYMAPEQIRGATVDARTDLFALGIMLYELVTGKRPFVGSTSADVSSSILRDVPPPLQSVRADLPQDLERIIGRCLEKDPERRVQTAKDVRNELELARREVKSGASAASATSQAPSSAAEPDVPSIAVLPFVNRSRDEEDEYFADGLADELLNVLAKIRGLRVAARTSSFQFKGKNEDLAVIGQKLHVATLLEGSVRRAGKRLRITVQLVKVADGFHLWSETYDRTLDDIFAVQDDIAQSVVKELRTTLLGEEPDSKASGEAKAQVAAAAKGRGENAEAHRLYLQGRMLVDRITHQDIAKGIGYLRQALDMDPSHALAWAQLSVGHSLEAGLGSTSVAEGNARAKEAAKRSLALEPDLVEGHLAQGLIQLLHDWDWKGADASLRRALELDPDNAEALRLAGLLAYDLARLDDAIALCRRSIEQDPLSVVGYANIGRAYRASGLLTDAEQAFRKVLEISPRGVPFRLLLSMVLLAQGKKDEALEVAQNELADWARLCGLAIVHYACGRTADSDHALGELVDKHAADASYQIAMAYAIREDADAVFGWLDRAFGQRDSGLALMKPEPLLRSVHADPRWVALLKKIGLED